MSMDPDPTRPSTEAERSYGSPPSYVTPGTTPTDPGPAPDHRGPTGPTNGFAVASLVLGIVGLTAFPVIPSVLALIFGYKGKREIDRSNGYQQGRGMAVAGIVLGWIALVLILLGIGLLFAAIAVGVAGSGSFEVPLRVRS